MNNHCEDILDFLDAHECREIRVRAALACSVLTPGDVAASDRDLLLEALDEMAGELREARKLADADHECDSCDDLSEDLEDARAEVEALQIERDRARTERDEAQLEINRLTYALGKLEDEHRALRKDLEVEGFRVQALEAQVSAKPGVVKSKKGKKS